MASRGHLIAARAESHAHHPVRMALESSDDLARGYIPQLGGSVMTRRHQALAIGTECHGYDLAGVTLQGSWIGTVGYIPQFGSSVLTSGGQQFPIRTENDAPDQAAVTLESGKSGIGQPMKIVPLETSQVLVQGGTVLLQ